MLHIFRIAGVRDKYDRLIPEYQLVYLIETGNSYAKIVSGESQMTNFLRSYAVVPTGQAERALFDLRHHGQTTIVNMEIPEKNLTALGLSQSPSDF